MQIYWLITEFCTRLYMSVYVKHLLWYLDNQSARELVAAACKLKPIQFVIYFEGLQTTSLLLCKAWALAHCLRIDGRQASWSVPSSPISLAGYNHHTLEHCGQPWASYMHFRHQREMRNQKLVSVSKVTTILVVVAHHWHQCSWT